MDPNYTSQPGYPGFPQPQSSFSYSNPSVYMQPQHAWQPNLPMQSFDALPPPGATPNMWYNSMPTPYQPTPVFPSYSPTACFNTFEVKSEMDAAPCDLMFSNRSRNFFFCDRDYCGRPVHETLMDIEVGLSNALWRLNYGEKVTHVYNPLDHASDPHRKFLEKFCRGQQSVLFLGMNPGPFGMGQTGVPFGEVTAVTDWLEVRGEVNKPLNEHPKRPIDGFDCTRKEVSGGRFWGFFKELCVTPDNFFRHCFVYNLCPLIFMALSGKNLTPPDLPKFVRDELNRLCDMALCDVVRLLSVTTIVGVGKFAEKRALTALGNAGIAGVKVHSIMHPSPANPAANKGWSDIAKRELDEIGILPLLLPPG